MNYDDALTAAVKALEIDRACLGTDHALYQDTWKVVEALKRLV